MRYWRSRALTSPAVDVMGVIERRARYTLAQLPADVSGEVRCGDSTIETARPGPPRAFRRAASATPTAIAAASADVDPPQAPTLGSEDGAVASCVDGGGSRILA